MSSSVKIGIGNTSFVFAKICKFWLDSLLSSFSVPNAHISIYLAIVNVLIISVFANLLKNYFMPLYSKDKRSITKTDDKLLRNLFEVIYLNDISHRWDFDGIHITVLCGANLILLFCYQGPVFFGSTY